jgi:hypothetical protein
MLNQWQHAFPLAGSANRRRQEIDAALAFKKLTPSTN